MAITVEIATVAVGHSGVAVTERLNGPAVANVGVHVAVGTSPYSRGDQLEVLDGGTAVFDGIIKSIVENPKDPAESGYLSLAINAVANIDLDRRRAQGKYTDTAAGDILKDIISSYGLSGSTTNIDDGPIIDDIRFDTFPTLKRAFSEVAQSADGYVWHIAANGDYHFNRLEDAASAAYNLTDSGSNYNYTKLRLSRTEASYFNRVIVEGGTGLGGEITETFAGANVTRAWYETKQKVGKGGANLVTVKSTTYDLNEASQFDDTVNGDYVFGSTRRGVQNVIDVETGTGTVEVKYEPVHTILYALSDRVEIAANGIYETVINDSAVTTHEGALLKAKGFLRDHGTFEYQTVRYETWVDPGAVGQKQTVTISNRNLDGTFILNTIVRQEVVAGIWRYQVTAVEDGVLRATGQRVRTAVQSISGKREDIDAEFKATRVIAEYSDVATASFVNTMT